MQLEREAMNEAITLPAKLKTMALAGAAPGQLIISPEGHLAITALWESTEPDSRHAVYVPLVGENAFKVQWIQTRQFRDLYVLRIEDCQLQVRVANMSALPVGFDIKDEEALALGGLFIDSGGLRVLAQTGDEDVSLDLASGQFAGISSSRRYLAAREWTLLMMREQAQWFAADIIAKAKNTGV